MATLRFAYHTIEFGDVDIHLRTLRDTQEYEDADGTAESLGIHDSNWGLFGVVWDSGHALARLMYSYDIKGRRILEVGCGIGLASLVLNHRGADITASDYHPKAGSFLQANVALNGGKEIPFVRANWDDQQPELGLFDLIIGSDLLYERDQAESLSGFIGRHAAPTSEVMIVDPGRGQSGRLTRMMEALGFEHTRHKHTQLDASGKPYPGHILQYKR